MRSKTLVRAIFERHSWHAVHAHSLGLAFALDLRFRPARVAKLRATSQ